MRLYLKYLCGRQVDNFPNPCVSGDIFKVFLYFLHGGRNEGKPDVIFIIPLIIMSDSRIAVYRHGKAFDFVLWNPCRT